MKHVRAALSIALALSCGACLGRPINGNCVWPDEPALRLDLRTSSDQRHLNADARFAEELAIRYADLTRGKKSRHFTDVDDYHRTRERCLIAVTAEVARSHGLSPADVAAAVGRRDHRLDASVLVVFALLYAFGVNRFLRQLFVRLPPDEPGPALAAAALAAIAVSVTGVIAGWIGSTIVEMIQIGDPHMSYRAERLLWHRHWLALEAGCVILYSLIAARRWRHTRTLAGPDNLRRT
jgi:hypothetical protein